MAKLDRFLQALVVHGGDSLRLTPGNQVQIERMGALRPLSREVLDQNQVAALIKELAPPSMAPLLGPSARLSFTYEGPMGPIEVELEPSGAGGVAVLRRRNGPGDGDGYGSSTATPAERAAARDEMEGLLRLLFERGASDLHLRVGEPPVFRRDGDLQRSDDEALTAEGLTRLLHAIMTPEIASAWAQSGDADWAWEIPDIGRLRCNAGRDRRGPTAVIRQIPAAIPSADELGLSRETQALGALASGLVLVTGPTGSGKSTTLAALLDLVNAARNGHILTIEDPIEFVHAGKKALVTQREVGHHTRSFASALKAGLREDPDVVFVGELRGLETIAMTLETAETGHLVLGTMHTTMAVGTIDRIIEQFPADQQARIRVLLASTLRGVVAQVLCRRVGGGRVAAREVLIVTPAIANLIREGKTFQIPSVMQTQRKTGMVTLNDALLALVDAGQIEPKEAFLKAVDKRGLVLALQSRGRDTAFST
jgi:twitching motility protein PilT